MDYQRHYDALIRRARSRDIDGYVERHHVVPRCLGGSDDPENIAVLTPEEHYVAHQLLVKIHPENAKMVFAALAMTRGRESNKRYGWLRRMFAVRIAELHRGKRGPLTQEHREKLAAAKLGKKQSPETVAKRAASNKGKTRRFSEEHRAAIGAAQVGTVRGPYARLECPGCGVTGAGGSMKRWHFDNCKVAAHGTN